MALHLVAFRLKNDITYPQRYRAVVSALDKLTQTKWESGTSLYLLLYNGTSDNLRQHLQSEAKLHAVDDLLLVMQIRVEDLSATGIPDAPKLDFILNLAGKPNSLSQLARAMQSQPTALGKL